MCISHTPCALQVLGSHLSNDVVMNSLVPNCFVASYPGFYRLQYEKWEGLGDFEMYVTSCVLGHVEGVANV